MLLFLAWLTISNVTSPHPRSFDMADHELASLNAEIVEAKARRDKLEVGMGGVVDRDMLFVAQKELVGLQEDKRRYIEKQGECLASRSPPLHCLLSPHACQRISKGGLSPTLGNLQRMTS